MDSFSAIVHHRSKSTSPQPSTKNFRQAEGSKLASAKKVCPSQLPMPREGMDSKTVTADGKHNLEPYGFDLSRETDGGVPECKIVTSKV